VWAPLRGSAPKHAVGVTYSPRLAGRPPGSREQYLGQWPQQETAYQQAVTVRTQLEALAADTGQLAVDGDPAARAIRDALRQQGILLPLPAKP